MRKIGIIICLLFCFYGCKNDEISTSDKENYVSFRKINSKVENKSLRYISGLLSLTNDRNYARIVIDNGNGSYYNLDKFTFQITLDVFILRAGNGFVEGRYPIADTYKTFTNSKYDLPENGGWAEGSARLIHYDSRKKKNRDWFEDYDDLNTKSGYIDVKKGSGIEHEFTFKITMDDGTIVEGIFKK